MNGRSELSIRELSDDARVALEQQLIARVRVRKPTIPQRALDGPCEVSFGQQRLWLLHQLDPTSPAYNISMPIRLTGRLNLAALESALSSIVCRHSVLRTTLHLREGELVQVVHNNVSVPIASTVLRGSTESSRRDEALAHMREAARQPFDLASDCMLRASLAQITGDEHLLLLTMHHAASDGWSLGVFFRELTDLYAAHCEGRQSQLPELPIQYADFAVWQREWLSKDRLNQQIDFWKNHLNGAPPTLELPLDRPRPAVPSYRSGSVSIVIPRTVASSIEALAHSERATSFMALLAAFNVLLARITGQDDIVVGSPIANRNRKELEGLIGFFVNTIALRTDLSADPTFRDLLVSVRDAALGAYAHQDLPFERLVEELHPERSLQHSPVFQAMFMLQNAPRQVVELPGLTISHFEADAGVTKFDIQLSMRETADGLNALLTYNTDLFDADRMQRLLGHFHTLLHAIAANPDLPISRLPLLTSDEQELILTHWNATSVSYPQVCLPQLFEQQVNASPHAIAIQFQHQTLSYQQLNERANQLAHFIRDKGITADTAVAICLQRSPQLIIALLAVLKAGAAYLPLDSANPSERLQFMLQDSQAPLLITTSDLLQSIEGFEGETLCLDNQSQRLAALPPKDLPALATLDNLAYVIYTSGSTGKPKGVMIEHRGLTNYLCWATQAYITQQGYGSPLHSSIAFDLSVTALFPPLLAGHTLTLLPADEGVQALGHLLSQAPDFSFVKLTPAHLELLGQQVPPETASRATGALVVGGEALLGEHLRLWREHAPTVRVINEYGPTETTVGCCVYEAAAGACVEGAIPIGRPIANTRLYVLDAHQQLVPIGVVGELYIGGAGVARGYLNRAELTRECFIADPFSSESGARLYRTGDLVKYVGDGNLVYVGRGDDQVKLRGHRIELGEIESCLREQEGVRDAVVIVREDTPGDRRLVAYLVPVNGTRLDWSEIRSSLRDRLAPYMVPATGVFLDALPLSTNGKVDRNALPEPNADSDVGTSLEFVGPRNRIEAALVSIWENLLKVRPIDVRDNFFDLGGHSLLAARMLADIDSALGRTLPLVSLFQGATIERLAALLEQADKPVWPTLVPIQPQGDRVPLFCVQRPNTNALGYMFLARRLGERQPLYGLQSQYRDEEAGPYTQEEYDSLALEYIAALQTVQPQGPYYLAGMCEGGHIAFEMARHLESQGQRVGMIWMLDVWPVENTMSYSRKVASRSALTAVRKMRGLVNRLRRSRKPDKNEQAGGLTVTPQNTPKVGSADIARLWRRRYWPGPSWVPTLCQAPITVFRCRLQPVYRIYDRSLGWQKRTTGEVRVVRVSGKHDKVLREPHVARIAKSVGEIMVRVSADDSTRSLPATE